MLREAAAASAAAASTSALLPVSGKAGFGETGPATVLPPEASSPEQVLLRDGAHTSSAGMTALQVHGCTGVSGDTTGSVCTWDALACFVCTFQTHCKPIELSASASQPNQVRPQKLAVSRALRSTEQLSQKADYQQLKASASSH